MSHNAVCCPRGKWELHVVHGCFTQLCGCDQQWDYLPTAVQLFRGNLSTVLPLYGSNANKRAVPSHREIFRGKQLILEKEKYSSTTAHCGNCLQKHHGASELATSVVQDLQDAGWMPTQAGNRRCNTLNTRQRTNKQNIKQKYHHCVILLIWNDHTPAPQLVQICSFR